MPHFEVTEPADNDIFEIGIYLGARSIKGAERFCREIEAAFERLAVFPGLGRERDEVRPALRSYVVGNNVVFYRPIDDGVRILRVLHGSRDISREPGL